MVPTPHCAMAVEGQSITCEQRGPSVLTLHLLWLWAKGSSFTQLLAAAENGLSGLLAFGSL